MALAQEPVALLLDEPMAGMGREESVALTRTLSRLKGRYAMLLVEHDMEAVFALADRVSVLTYGRVLATGAPDAVRADPAVREAYLGEDAA
jgi:branched-chain amino acid transport system ATP-binding protein